MRTLALALGVVCGACAGYVTTPEPDQRFACLDGLSIGRIQQLMEWTADTMGVSPDVPTPWIECASPELMAALYGAAGSDSEHHLGVYVAPAMMVLVNESRIYSASEWIIVHELAHHLQWQNGLAQHMTKAEREKQAEAVHTRWMDTR